MSSVHVLAAILMLTTTQASPSPQSSGAETGQSRAGSSAAVPKVLFLCPHGAARSVLASAYFIRAARERGLNVRVDAAGIEPDAGVAAAVSKHLTGRGYPLPITAPRRVTAEEVEQADLVISLGCDLKDLPAPHGTLRRWDDVPAPSEDFAAADQAIYAKVMALVEELVRSGGTLSKNGVR
jgi:arsenate reductase (thioredoxin)